MKLPDFLKSSGCIVDKSQLKSGEYSSIVIKALGTEGQAGSQPPGYDSAPVSNITIEASAKNKKVQMKDLPKNEKATRTIENTYAVSMDQSGRDFPSSPKGVQVDDVKNHHATRDELDDNHVGGKNTHKPLVILRSKSGEQYILAKTISVPYPNPKSSEQIRANQEHRAKIIKESAPTEVKPGDMKVVMKKSTGRPNPIKGGVGDKLKPEDVDPEQLEAGIEVEMEHVKDDMTKRDDEKKAIAQDISLDHLQEDSLYYSKLKKIEKTVLAGLINRQERSIERARLANQTTGEPSRNPRTEDHAKRIVAFTTAGKRGAKILAAKKKEGVI